MCLWGDPMRMPLEPRNRLLCERLESATAITEDIGMFSDGGYASRYGVTFGAQVRAFGRESQYWGPGRPAADPALGRSPRHIGYEAVTIHTAELWALILALRWRRTDRWNLLVPDRSALFAVM